MLIQEEQIGLPHWQWRIMVACICMGRKRGEGTRGVLTDLFELWHSPESMRGCPGREFHEILQPFGFDSDQRVALYRLSGHMTLFPDAWPGTTGLGQYAKDSWDIFVDREYDIKPEDAKLRAYLDDPMLSRLDDAYSVLEDAMDWPESDIIPWNTMKESVRHTILNDDVLFFPAVLQWMRPRLKEMGIPLYRIARTLADKGRDYGDEQLVVCGAQGITIRSFDKVCRGERMTRLGLENVKEPYTDCVLDLTGYAVLGILLEKGLICAA